MTNSQKSHVLFVDDNQNLLSAVRRTLRGQAELTVAESAEAALAVLERDPKITVVISDQKMPGMKGIEFLATVAQRWPLVTRIMQTGNADQDTAISAISESKVFRFLRKPYEPQDLIDVIKEAQADNEVKRAEHVLLETTLASSVKLMTEMLSMMRPDLFAQSTKVQELVKPLAVELKLSQPWELNLAAMLYPLGLAMMPAFLIEKRRKGTRLNEAEMLALAQSGVVAGELVVKIPKLERVATYLRYCRKGYDGSGLPRGEEELDTPKGAIYLLPLLIDIVELADIHGVSLKDAAQALEDRRAKYHPFILETVTKWLQERTEFEQTFKRAVREMTVGEIRVGDVVVNDLFDENGKLLLAGGSELNDFMVKRIQMLSAGRASPRQLAVSRAI